MSCPAVPAPAAVCVALRGHQHPLHVLWHPRHSLSTDHLPSPIHKSSFRFSGLQLDLRALSSCEAVSDYNTVTALPMLRRGNINV